MLPLFNSSGTFDGALVIVLDVKRLELLVRSRDLANGAVLFIYDANGHILAASNSLIATALIAHSAASARAGNLRETTEFARRKLDVAIAPLRGGAITVAFAMPQAALFDSTYLNVGADFLMPIMMISFAWLGVWFAAERVVTRWILYLRRLSAVYRRGAYGIRPSLTARRVSFGRLARAWPRWLYRSRTATGVCMMRWSRSRS